MSDSPAATAAKLSVEANFPRCLRCNKPVDRLIVTPNSDNPDMVMIKFECHGETVSQDISSSLLEGERGLASFTVFNDFTSGLLPAKTSKQAGKKSSKKKGKK